ncbi:mannosyl-oligosaccharide 1,2-alpha-mannosidase [Delitschia confertaspora ATCC 74209]|uniref:alpha-1,2-Mannosidase n=1 Tax=Delitschia confertaspora ATCC 74209 TaxID=1513339 RepID=A0A9P4JRI3_9PLEO|nr:mannosyl-oligosaccharide 1,2-alpha-mannosidase [Delitschia confertaspora ATCC 74209]
MSSFSIPRNIPNFENAQRRLEDSVWNKFNGKEKGLPMYKDKPAGYKRGRTKWLRGKRGLGLAGFVVLVCFYWLGWLGGGGGKDGGRGGSGSGWGILKGGKKGKGIDWEARRQSVRDAFKLSWGAYEKYGWAGYDEFHPLSKNGRYMAQPNGLGWIIVDALDTMMLMNLTTELVHAKEWISTTLSYDKDQDVNTFETTIRMLGGLLSAHYLQDILPGMKSDGADEDLYLEKATDLADRLMGAYDSPSGVPWASVILKTGKGVASHADGGASSTAEATTLQLEMKYLAYLTGEEHYWQKAEKVMSVVDNNGAKDGLVPIFIYADRGFFRGSEIRLGSRGDSYYEYLIKQYLQTQKQEPVYLDMWEEALRGVKKHLITYSKDSNFTVLAERPSGIEGKLHPKMDHLVCFMPGTIALGATGGLPLSEARKAKSWGKKEEEDIQLARELMKTCVGMYKVTPTGLAPEIAHFNIYDPPLMMRNQILPSKPDATSFEEKKSEDEEEVEWKKDYIIKPADSHNLQRPETVESLFYMWRITGDEVYRQWGWEMFEAFAKYTMVEDGGGFSSINDVMTTEPGSRDNMESFWLAETLKYFYLLFGPNDILPLTDIVLNTEAHPFPRFDASKKHFKTGWKRIPRDEKGNLIREEKGEGKAVEGEGKKEGEE